MCQHYIPGIFLQAPASSQNSSCLDFVLFGIFHINIPFNFDWFAVPWIMGPWIIRDYLGVFSHRVGDHRINCISLDEELGWTLGVPLMNHTGYGWTLGVLVMVMMSLGRTTNINIPLIYQVIRNTVFIQQSSLRSLPHIIYLGWVGCGWVVVELVCG